MAGSRSNPGQTVTRARGRFGTTSFGSRRRLCPAYLSPAFSFWRVSSYLMTRLSPHLPPLETSAKGCHPHASSYRSTLFTRYEGRALPG